MSRIELIVSFGLFQVVPPLDIRCRCRGIAHGAWHGWFISSPIVLVQHVSCYYFVFRV